LVLGELEEQMGRKTNGQHNIRRIRNKESDK